MRRLVGSEPEVPNSGTHWAPKGAKMSFLLPMVTDRMRLSYEADMQTKPWFGLKNEGGSRFPWPESGDVKKLVETCISDSWSCSRFTP